MRHRITVHPGGRVITARSGENLLDCLRRADLAPQAPCGGSGTCGKCKVLVDGREVSACRTPVQGDMTVTLPHTESAVILTEGIVPPAAGGRAGLLLAMDIGTTTVAAFLLDGPTGQLLAKASAPNPQASFGADVVTRIRHALDGQMPALTAAIRTCAADLTRRLCAEARVSPDSVTLCALVGNPTMQQLFLGILPDNLARIPFTPVLTRAETRPAREYLPLCPHAELLIVPNIAGYVGADALACLLAADLPAREEWTLLVDIGTNGEMVLGSRHRMVCCATAAGPALEGANIRFGMVAQAGAIDHVRLENGQFRCSVIDDAAPVGICGSGLIDAVAAALDAGLINDRGRILTEDRRIQLTDRIYLTQDDIRQVQLAKGAIAAGIEEMAAHLGITLRDIHTLELAGAFGTFMDPRSACRICLLPPILETRIHPVGNAAGSGAQILALDPQALYRTQELADRTEYLELAASPTFQGHFARQMYFPTPEQYWLNKALSLGFTHAAPLDPATLIPRADVREMCRADRCRAYGKNWTCPPHCGTLEECAARLAPYGRGLLLQTVGHTSKTVDTAAYRRTEQTHLAQFYQLTEEVRKVFPEALCLGSGGCRICSSCAWPEPCRFPQKACASMEAYGLFVTQVCRDNGCAYHHGDGTVTYTSCVLF